MTEDGKIVVTSFLFFLMYVIVSLVRYTGDNPGFGYNASGYICVAMMSCAAILLLFIRVIGKDSHWTLFWAVGAIGVSCTLVQTAITGADMCQALQLNATTTTVITTDFFVLGINAVFWTLLVAYVNEWRPYQTSDNLRYGLMTAPENSGLATRGTEASGN